MVYRYETTSLEGCVQQLASNILPHGYWFYVTGVVPVTKDPRIVDRKLIEKYGINISRQQRVRRKLAGLANLHYLRLDRWWILLATHGVHPFFQEEGGAVRDARKAPIRLGGYSLTVKQGHYLRNECQDDPPVPDGRMRVRVQIARDRYKELLAHFESLACHRSAETLGRLLWLVPFEPYAPVRRQLLNLLRRVNKKRQVAGLPKVAVSSIRFKRTIVKPFGDETPPDCSNCGPGL